MKAPEQEEKKEETPVQEEVKKEEEVVEEKPQRRPAIDKQTAFVEFKQNSGKPIESAILQFREDTKSKRVQTKDLTEKINMGKRMIDNLKAQLDKKEEERRQDRRKQQLDFDDDQLDNEEIIDEEELTMLKDMKELKREYRNNFNDLKGLKQELKSLQENIDRSKEQLIMAFEQWYAEEFDQGSGDVPLGNVTYPTHEDKSRENSKTRLSSQNGSQKWNLKSDDVEDEDAAVYRRAK